jgi:hypothetical protein
MWKWILFVLAMIVIASPLDLWPDLFPLGSLDDVALAIAAMQAFEKARVSARPNSKPSSSKATPNKSHDVTQAARWCGFMSDLNGEPNHESDVFDGRRRLAGTSVAGSAGHYSPMR